MDQRPALSGRNRVDASCA